MNNSYTKAVGPSPWGGDRCCRRGGGLAGKGVGEHIDPTTADSHLRDSCASRPYAKAGSYESHITAYQYGG